MKMVVSSCRAAAGILFAGSLAVCPHAAAQMGDGAAPQMNMGGGRMVRGTITAVAPDKLILKTEAGEIYTVALTPNTQLRHGRDQMKLADVHVGDGAGAMGELDGPNKTVHALFVTVVGAEEIKKARDAMGKTYISGTITAIDETRLTIKRSDDVVQVIQVDEDTSFRKGGRAMQMAFGNDAGGFGGGGGGNSGGGGGRRGGGQAGSGNGGPPSAQSAAPPEGESITLADIKVGSMVAGPGSIKNGVFVPTTLGVGDPAAQRQRRRSDSSAPASKSAPPSAPATPPTEKH